MFPFDTDIKIQDMGAGEGIPYREYEIDPDTGQLTGRIVEGKEAVKTWIYLALHTERYNFQQYSWDYGSEIGSLIGRSSDMEYLELEAKRLIEDCLKQNKHITGISGLQVSTGRDTLHMSFVVHTDYGEAKVVV